MTSTKTVSEQSLKGAARRKAKDVSGPKAEIAEQAVKEAKAQSKRRPQQPFYATQNKDVAGENLHHDKQEVVSEFDDPAAHMVRSDQSA